MIRTRRFYLILFSLAAFTVAGCRAGSSTVPTPSGDVSVPSGTETHPFRADAPRGLVQTVEYGISQPNFTFKYDPAYVRLDYPGGDVPLETGVCTDVVIRAFRKGGVDLQKEVHEDMERDFAVYPQIWGARGPDSNIDHRRVPNLMKFFERKGKALPVTANPDDYQPGDVVSWTLGDPGPPHVGLVTNLYSTRNNRYLIVHNIGRGARIEDVLFTYKITGHYRYF